MIFNLCCCFNFSPFLNSLFRSLNGSMHISLSQHKHIHLNFICSLPILLLTIFVFIFRTLVEEKCEKSVQTFLLLPIEFVTQNWDTRYGWVWLYVCVYVCWSYVYALNVSQFSLYTTHTLARSISLEVSFMNSITRNEMKEQKKWGKTHCSQWNVICGLNLSS